MDLRVLEMLSHKSPVLQMWTKDDLSECFEALDEKGLGEPRLSTLLF